MAVMMKARPGSVKDKTPIAIIAVCLNPHVLGQIMDEIGEMPWSPAYEHVDEYFAKGSRPHLSTHVKNAKVCVAFVDLDDDIDAALQTVESLQQNLQKRVLVVALSSDQHPQTILKAMRAGCSEYLSKPLEEKSVSEALARLEDRISSEEGPSKPKGSVLSLLGAKGGVGTTTLAVHLALHLVVNQGKKTLLIDNHPGLGHVSLYLGLEGAHHSFRDLLRSVDRLDADLLKGFVVTHSSGLDVIASAELHDGMREAHADAIRRTLEFMREEYEYVLLDCATPLDDATMAAVEKSDNVWLVATPDIGAVRDLARLVDGLIGYRQPAEKLKILMNRSGSKGAMSPAQIEKAVLLPIALNIQNNYLDLAKAANMGMPVPPEDKSAFSSQMRQWSGEVAAEGEPQPAAAAPKKRFSFWKAS